MTQGVKEMPKLHSAQWTSAFAACCPSDFQGQEDNQSTPSSSPGWGTKGCWNDVGPAIYIVSFFYIELVSA